MKDRPELREAIEEAVDSLEVLSACPSLQERIPRPLRALGHHVEDNKDDRLCSGWRSITGRKKYARKRCLQDRVCGIRPAVARHSWTALRHQDRITRREVYNFAIVSRALRINAVTRRLMVIGSPE